MLQIHVLRFQLIPCLISEQGEVVQYMLPRYTLREYLVTLRAGYEKLKDRLQPRILIPET